MKTFHRDYSEESGDFNRLCRFATHNNDAVRAYSTWCVGRIVDWKYGLYESKRSFTAFCNQNAHLWFDGFDELAGFVICENGDAGFTIITLPGYRFLYEEMLAWTLENWGQRDAKMYTEITENQGLEASILERCGFTHQADFFVRSYDLTQELAPQRPLEPGFTIVDMASHNDIRAQRILRADAFQDKAEISEDELQAQIKFYNYSQNGPIYHPQTDLCVMAPNGQFVAGCEALIDAYNAEADIERVCTHSSFRKRGFARAVIQECLYRLKQMGLRRAYIMGYSPEAIALYGSLGATKEQKCCVYESGSG